MIGVEVRTEFAVPYADLNWNWTGPNAERLLNDFSVRNWQPDRNVTRFMLALFNVTQPDLGRYEFTVRLHSNSACSASFDREVQLFTDERSMQMSSYMNCGSLDDGHLEVFTSADDTDSPVMTAKFQLETGGDYDVGDRLETRWSWPNAGRTIHMKDAEWVVREDRNDYSLVVRNATAADLGRYWFSVWSNIYGCLGIKSMMLKSQSPPE